jgi:hypothetical protein
MVSDRKVIDTELCPADIPGEFAISGDEEEILNIAVQDAVESRGYRDTPALREQFRSILRDRQGAASDRERVAEVGSGMLPHNM